jgi:arabinofuranan 3-O-arabinosyltransferase
MPQFNSTHGSAESLLFLCVAVFALFSTGIYFFQLHDLALAMSGPGVSPLLADKDFANYWMAGNLVRDGTYNDLWLQSDYFRHLQAAFGDAYGIRNWSYPPHFLLLVWPLGFLSYKFALVVFLVGTFGLFMWSVSAFRRSLAKNWHAGLLFLVLVPYTVMMLVTTQNGFLTSALLLLGLARMRHHPIQAGLCFALLTIKPQLGLLVPLLLVFDRNWATIRWAAIATLLLLALSVVFFGLDSWHLYLTETLAYQRYVMTDWQGIFLRMMPTVFGSVRTLGFRPEAALALQWPVSVISAALVAWVLWKEKEPLRRVFAITVGTFLVSPYGFNYDMGACAVTAGLLLGSPRAPMSRPATFLVAIVAMLPAVVMNLGRAGFPIAPIVLLVALLDVAIEGHRRSGLATGATPIPAS